MSDPSINPASAALAAETAKAGGAQNAPHNTGKHDRARETADAFEAMFLAQMLEHMSSGLNVDPVFGGGHGEQAYRSLLNEQYAKAINKSGGIGVSDAIYREILRLQETSQ
jgi:Rod binding domain-containing protein